jgi:putative oxidoreductase
MVTAIRKVHLANGPWAAQGGWEYNAVLVAALVLLAEQGPGPVSVDKLRGKEHSGFLWGLGALALGAAASTATIEAGRRAAPAAAPASAAGDAAAEPSAPFGETAGDPVTAD